MASLRPYGYPGGTLYTSASSNNGKGYAMYYDGWFNQCGWAALFYNNTGKDIIITELRALAGANPSAFTARFECSDVGTSAPNTINESSLANVADVTIPYCGKTISSWVSTTSNIKIAKGHYFIVGLRSINAGGDHWFNLARTGNNANSCPYNCYFMQKNSSNGATTWTRDWSSGWRYQTPEIMVYYKDAAIQVYLPGGKTSISDSFYMGAVKSYSLTNCNTESFSKNNDHIGAKISSDKKTLYVWANLLDSTQTATITVYGYNSSATLNVTAYPSKITSCNIDASVLKPGQSANFSYSHEGAHESYTEGTNHSNTGTGKNWEVSYDYPDIANPNSSIITITDNKIDNKGTIEIGEIINVSDSFTDGSKITVERKVWTSYGGERYISGTGKSDSVTLKHWLASDINVSLNQNLLRLYKGSHLTVSNKTYLTNVSDHFNEVTISFDPNDSLSEHLEFKKFDSVKNDFVTCDDDSITISKGGIAGIFVKDTLTNDMTFSDEHTLNIKLTNDVVVTTTLKFKTAPAYDFDFIYPKNVVWETTNFSDKWVEDESIARKTIAKLPVYRTGKKEDSQKISVFNYPIQIQMPTLKSEDIPNKTDIPDFKLSLYDCHVILNGGKDTIEINSATLGRYDSAINASGHNVNDTTANERIILVNCDIPISADNIAKKNLAEITSYGNKTDDVKYTSSVTTSEIYIGECSGDLHISFNAINYFVKSSTVFNSIQLIDESGNAIGDTVFIESGVLGSDNDQPIKHEIDVNLDSLERSKIELRIRLYNSDNKSINTIIALSDIIVNNLTNDDVPGILLTDDYSMVLGLLLTRVNDNGEENVGNEPGVTYNTVHHMLKIDCNVFNECDLTTDRTNQKMQYKNQIIVDNETGETYAYDDYTLRRAICDSSRIGYMYGRLLTDETLGEPVAYDSDSSDNKMTYSDDFEAIDSHFINTDKAETDKDYGLPLSDSRLYLDSLLSAMNDLLHTIKTSDKCKSNQSLKDKLKTPRKSIALGYPIMWNDNDVLDTEAKKLSKKYENNLTLKKIFDKDKYELMSKTLSEKTASPFKELIDCVSSFQDSIPLANVVILDEEGNECTVLFRDDNKDGETYKLGVIDY